MGRTTALYVAQIDLYEEVTNDIRSAGKAQLCSC